MRRFWIGAGVAAIMALLTILTIGRSPNAITGNAHTGSAREALSSRREVELEPPSPLVRGATYAKTEKHDLLLRPEDLLPGEHLKFHGHQLIKLSAGDNPTPIEIEQGKERWENEVRRFFTAEIGGENAYENYLSIKANSFSPYEAAVVPIENAVNRELGHDFGIVLTDEVAELYKNSNLSYEKKMTELLGPVELIRFKEFRQRYVQSERNFRITNQVVR